MIIKVPKRIKYHGVVYDIIYDDSDAMEDKWGLFSYGTKKLILNTALIQPESCLFHELAHMISKHAHLDDLIPDDKVRDNIDNVFAEGFYTIFTDNLTRLVKK